MAGCRWQDKVTLQAWFQMADPLHIFHMDKKFAHNGVHMDRSILMGFFASEGPIRPGGLHALAYILADSYENLTTIVKLSSAGYLVEVLAIINRVCF